MYRPEFTQHQKDDLCYVIGDWYFYFKDNFINSYNDTHRLGHLCDTLIWTIKSQAERMKIDNKQLSFITDKINHWYELSKDTIVHSYKDKTHTLGSKKEILKMLVCDDKEEMNKLLDEYLGRIIGEEMKNIPIVKGEFINKEELQK